MLALQIGKKQLFLLVLSPAFQLRLYDPRINRWLTTDPYGQYHSPYMSMDNRWNMSTDPTGGCTDPDCDHTHDDGFLDEVNLGTFKGGGLEGLSFNLNMNPTWQQMDWQQVFSAQIAELKNNIYAEQAKYRPFLVGVAGAMAVPLAIPGLAASTSYVSTQNAWIRFGHSTMSEVFSSIKDTGGLGNVNVLGIVGDTFLPNFGGKLLTSTVEFNFNERKFAVNSFDKILINLSVDKVNDKLHGIIGKWSSQLGGRGAVKGLEHVFKVGTSITTGTFSNYMLGN